MLEQQAIELRAAIESARIAAEKIEQQSAEYLKSQRRREADDSAHLNRRQAEAEEARQKARDERHALAEAHRAREVDAARGLVS